MENIINYNFVAYYYEWHLINTDNPNEVIFNLIDPFGYEDKLSYCTNISEVEEELRKIVDDWADGYYTQSGVVYKDKKQYELVSKHIPLMAKALFGEYCDCRRIYVKFFWK